MPRDAKNPYDLNDYQAMQLRKHPYDLSSPAVRKHVKRREPSQLERCDSCSVAAGSCRACFPEDDNR